MRRIDPRADVEERRERVEVVPDRSDERRDRGDRHPAVHPQEQARDLGRAGPAGDALDDDPYPADEPEDPEQHAQPGGWQVARRRCVRAIRAHVADEHEDERQRDRRRGAGEVDRKRQTGSCRTRSGCARRRPPARPAPRSTPRQAIAASRAARVIFGTPARPRRSVRGCGSAGSRRRWRRSRAPR